MKYILASVVLCLDSKLHDSVTLAYYWIGAARGQKEGRRQWKLFLCGVLFLALCVGLKNYFSLFFLTWAPLQCSLGWSNLQGALVLQVCRGIYHQLGESHLSDSVYSWACSRNIKRATELVMDKPKIWLSFGYQLQDKNICMVFKAAKESCSPAVDCFHKIPI